MPINNSQGVFNTGRDITVVVVTPLGNLQLDNVTGFDSKGEFDQIKVKRLDGVVLNAELPWGWSGSFDLERGGPQIDLYFAQAEAAWYAGGTYNVAQIFTYITEPDGSTSTFAYDNVAMTYQNAGDWKGDASVKIKVGFQANRRRSV